MSLSPVEVEYRAMVAVTYELASLRYTFKDLGVQGFSLAKL